MPAELLKFLDLKFLWESFFSVLKNLINKLGYFFNLLYCIFTIVTWHSYVYSRRREESKIPG